MRFNLEIGLIPHSNYHHYHFIFQSFSLLCHFYSNKPKHWYIDTISCNVDTTLCRLWIWGLCPYSPFFHLSRKIVPCQCSQAMTSDNFLVIFYGTKWPLCTFTLSFTHSLPVYVYILLTCRKYKNQCTKALVSHIEQRSNW